MYRNYLTIVFRKFYRDKLYMLINLAGLSLAVACCLILGIYLHSEFTFDQHNVNHKHIYRVANDYSINNTPTPFAVTSPVLAPMLSEDYNEVEAYARLYHTPALIRHKDKAFYWQTVYIADQSIFDLFTHEIIYGDSRTALIDDNNIAVSESFAQKYFGNANPVGKIVRTDDWPPMTIGLVFADLPENSHHKYDVLFSAITRPETTIPTGLAERRKLLNAASLHSYLMFEEGFDPANFEAMADAFIERHFFPAFGENKYNIRYWLEPLADIHLQSDAALDEPTGNLAYLYALISVAIFIIFVACINYINLATARSVKQAKQVGMRKILGANQGALITQFLAEAIVLALLSVLLGVVVVELITTLTPISELFGRSLEFSLVEQPQIMLWLLLFGLIIGLATGLYPALYLSSWAPLSVLVSNQISGSANLRKTLVLAQFTVSVAVVACTLLMADQMRYLSEKPLGFEKDNRIAIRMTGWDLIQTTSVIKKELLKHPDILGVTTAHPSTLPGERSLFYIFNVEDNEGAMSEIDLIYAEVSGDYLEAMGMRIVEGRDFSRNLLTDDDNYIVNETMVKKMGWDEPIGKRIRDGRVIGVVEDFHFKSLHSAVEPIALYNFQDKRELTPRERIFWQRFMIVNTTGDNIHETVSYLEERFQEYDPRHPFDFQFLDDALDQLYETDQRLISLISLFAGVCIFIACLGLFGLASFTTEQRNKEIGIRKTLGASAGQIVFLLSKSILSLVLIGAVFGCIAAYFAINLWLANFAYRADMSLAPYLIATVAALLVAYLTVAMQSYKTAQADPVDALRYE
jgi:putative ABC transport system permease protein